MNDVLPAEVLELQRRMGGAPGQRPAGTWTLPAAPKPSAPPAMLALSPEPALGSDADFPRGLSPVNSSSSLDSSPVRSPGPPHAVAIYCQFVGGGLQGSVDLCASVTLVDECGHVLLDTLVKPSIPVTDYRHGDTGLTAEDLSQGMPFRKARKIVLGYLRGGASSPTRLECQQGRKVLLVGTSLQRTLNCLMLDYPEDCLREVGAFEDTKGTATENLHQHNAEMAGLILRHFMDC